MFIFAWALAGVGKALVFTVCMGLLILTAPFLLIAGYIPLMFTEVGPLKYSDASETIRRIFGPAIGWGMILYAGLWLLHLLGEPGLHGAYFWSMALLSIAACWDRRGKGYNIPWNAWDIIATVAAIVVAGWAAP